MRAVAPAPCGPRRGWLSSMASVERPAAGGGQCQISPPPLSSRLAPTADAAGLRRRLRRRSLFRPSDPPSAQPWIARSRATAFFHPRWSAKNSAVPTRPWRQGLSFWACNVQRHPCSGQQPKRPSIVLDSKRAPRSSARTQWRRRRRPKRASTKAAAGTGTGVAAQPSST